MTKKQKKVLIRIFITVILMAVLHFTVPEDHPSAIIFYLVPYLIIGYDILYKAFRGIVGSGL